MSKKLTPSVLRKMILSEKGRIDETLETGNTETGKVKAQEVQADGYAKTLIKHVDWMKQLSIKESKLKKELIKTRAQKSALRNKIMKNME